VLAEYSIIAPGWLEAVVRAHRDEEDAIGGPIEKDGTSTIVEHAIYLLEYADLAPPIKSQFVERIPGTNASYPRNSLGKTSDSTLRNCWEYFIHQEMAAEGVRFRLESEMLVRHKKEYTFGYFLKQRFHLSRSFAAMRQERVSSSRKIKNVLLVSVLGPYLFIRVLGRTVHKPRLFGLFLWCLPVLLIFLTCYVVGELVGYTAGAGTSTGKVE
jgi:hypothetical protein